MGHDDPESADFLPLHRSEALTDGIYAVAMTLLVIELKLPEHAAIASAEEYAHILAELVPKALAWVISFIVLAIFWIAHHRVFAMLRHADAKLIVYNLLQLAFVSLMPFSSAIVGASALRPVTGQLVFSLNMALLGVCGWLIVRHVFRHPELTRRPMRRPRYIGSALRIGGVVLVSVVALAITAAAGVSGIGNMAFMLMALVTPLSRVFERRALAAEGRAVTATTDG